MKRLWKKINIYTYIFFCLCVYYADFEREDFFIIIVLKKSDEGKFFPNINVF
jgi:hypothetical protein